MEGGPRVFRRHLVVFPSCGSRASVRTVLAGRIHGRLLHLAHTIIGVDLVVDGNLQSEDSIRVDGRVLGRVDSTATIEVGPTGSVSSEVSAKRVSVAGAVAGNVGAKDRVDLLAGAKLTGDVRSPRLTIADGANFRGKVDMDV